MFRASTRAAMAALLSGRVDGFVSSAIAWRPAGISRVTATRCFSMMADSDKVGFIGETAGGTFMFIWLSSLLACNEAHTDTAQVALVVGVTFTIPHLIR